jgi:hypothetical protein
MNSSVKSTIQAIEGMVERGNRDQAFNAIKEGLRYYPREARLWYWLARCVDNTAHASDALRRALQFDPSFEEAQELFVWIQTGGDPTQWVPASETAPAPVTPSPSQWSLLNELGGGEEEEDEYPTSTPPGNPTPAPRKEEFAFLAEMENQLPTATLATPGLEAAPVTESSLWQRAYAFIGEPEDERFLPEPPRGRFSFSDVPPSPVQDIPVRNTLTPLSTDQVNLLIEEEEKPKKANKAAPTKSQTPKTKRERTRTSSNSVRRILVPLAVLASLGILGWAVLRFDATPAAVRDLHPAVATGVAEAYLRVAPPPTPFPTVSWLSEVADNRYANRITQSEGFLRQGIASEPDNLIARFVLSDVLREQEGLEAESLVVAQEAADRVQTLEERAYAAQALVWAIAAQPEIGPDDLASAQVAAEQSAALVPNSPHAQWARAMYAALVGNTSEAESAASLAASLDTSLSAYPAVAKARQAEVAYRAGQWELAVQLYEQALRETDYVPWRANLIEILQENDRDAEAISHIAALRAIDPEHPILQGE